MNHVSSLGRLAHLAARRLIVHDRLYFDVLPWSRLHVSLVPRTSWLNLIGGTLSNALNPGRLVAPFAPAALRSKHRSRRAYPGESVRLVTHRLTWGWLD